MGKILPILLVLFSVSSAISAGIFLRPEPVLPELAANPCGDEAKTEEKPADKTETELTYVSLKNQFVIPVVSDNKVGALVVISLSVEVSDDDSELIFAKEPKIRDAFLQVFFDHANSGGFKGAFTNSNNMAILRKSLREAADDTLAGKIKNVLITSITRQDTK